jgi:hypothetical protein
MIHALRQNISYSKVGEVFYLKPFFDIHWGSTACDEKKFKSDLAATCDNTYYWFGGDVFDSIIVGDHRYRKSGDKSAGDAIVDENLDEMSAILEPYKNRIVGISRGNHEDTITKRCGTDIIARLCRRLGVNDGGYSGLFRISFRTAQGRGRTVVVRYHHGWGGGSRTAGADLTKYSKDVAYWDADVFLYGHVHRRQTDSVPRIGLCGDALVSKPKIMAICGTYLKTYTGSKQPTYSELKGYAPVEIGGVCISIKTDRQWVKMKAYLD